MQRFFVNDMTMMAICTVTLPALIHMVSGPVGGRVFDVRGAYALYVIGVIVAALGWLTMKVIVKVRRMEERSEAPPVTHSPSD